MLLKPAPKTQDSQANKRHDIAPLDIMSGRVQYEKGRRDEEDGKDKRGEENKEGERGGRNY